MASGKCEPHTYFTFLQSILTFTHMKKFNIFCIIYVVMSNIHFSGLDNVKMTCITQVSFKITIRKRHVFFDIRWPWIWNQYFYLGNWNDVRTKMITLPSFHSATRLNQQKRNEADFIKRLWYIILYMNIVISNWHYWNIDNTKMKFFSLFQFLTRFTVLQAPENL